MRRTLRILVVVVYVAIAALALTLAAPALRDFYLVLARPAVWIPNLPSPIVWVLPSIVVVAGLYHVVDQTLAGRKVRKSIAGLMLLAASGLVLLGAWPYAKAAPESPPAARLEHALSVMRARLAKIHEAKGSYPRHYPETVLHDEDGARLLTGYLGHGRAIPFRVVDRPNTGGPALVARAADGPGTVYYAVGRGGERYWITALLSAGVPVGPTRFVRRTNGKPVIVTPGQGPE